MTMWAVLIVLPGLVCTVLGAPVSSCPKSCSCTATETRCTSLDFLNKTPSPEQIKSIATLDVSATSLIKINPNLKSLNRLKRINLSSNKIQHITAAYLPKSLEYLDLSKNSIRYLPQDLHSLTALKEINLSGNPIVCNCDSVSVRDALLKKGVVFAQPPKCDSPEELRGKSWLSVPCERRDIENLFEEMQGDAPYEGSGSGEVSVITESASTEAPEKWDSSIEEEFIRVDPSAKLESGVSTEEPPTEQPDLEGSGEEPVIISTSDSSAADGEPEITTETDDEDYENYDDIFAEATTASEPPAVTADMALLNRGRMKACIFNCSTPTPVDFSNDTDEPPGLLEGIGILVHDLNIMGDPETTSTTTTEAPATVGDVPVEIGVERGKAIDLNGKNVTSDAEIIDNGLNSEEETGNISNEPSKQSNSTFIFLSVLLVIIVGLVIYAIVKKRQMKRSRRLVVNGNEEKEAIPEEIELLKKPVSQTDKPNGTHEAIPLMNGHNENQNKNAEELLSSDTNDLKPTDNGEDVELRPKKTEQKHLLTPETKRVTIKASEIPNSTPKTPILVTRHLNSDGSIVTTPNVDQHV